MEVKNVDITDDNVLVITMEVNQLPVFSIDNSQEIIKWGGDNNYPSILKNAFDNHPEHNAIVKGKARYLSGTGIIPSIDTPVTKQFLAKANRSESVYEVVKKLKSDYPLYGGFAARIAVNILGRPIGLYHMDMGKLRRSTCNTGLWYSDDWKENSSRTTDKTFYPFYVDGIKTESIYFYKDHTPSLNKLDGLYPVPDYSSVLLDIDTDIEIAQFSNSLVKNGFSAGHIITFFNGKFTPDEKNKIEGKFKHKHQGTENAGKVVLVFTDKDSQPTNVESITPNGLAEQHVVLTERNENKIVRGHNVPRALFKIETEGSLGDRTTLDLQHELFINEYVKPGQVPFNEFLKKMIFVSRGVVCEFEVQQVEPIGKELQLDNVNIVNALNARDPNIITNYIIKKYALDVPVAEISQEVPAVTQVKQDNDSQLANLRSRQRQALDTIARKFTANKITEVQAIMQLKPFGFTEEEAKMYLGIEVNQQRIQQENHEKDFFALVQLHTVEVDESDEVVDERPYNFKLKVDDFISDDKKTKEKKKSFFEGLIDTFRKKSDNNDYDIELYTVYKYGLRPELKGQPELLPTSHDFCIKMLAATTGNKRLTYEFIDSLDNGSDGDNTNAWDFRGGFWGKKPYCRHVWIGETRKRLIKKTK